MMTRDAKDEGWIRRNAMMNDKTRRSMNGFTRVRKRRNQRICHAGLFRRGGNNSRCEEVILSVVRILLTNEPKRGVQDTHDQPNVEYQEKRNGPQGEC